MDNRKLSEPEFAENYAKLAAVLDEAYDRASKGKGVQRHGEGRPFERQDICTELSSLGLAPAVFQIRKKAKELLRLFPEDAMNEALDIIVYAAALHIALEESSPKTEQEEPHGMDRPETETPSTLR